MQRRRQNCRRPPARVRVCFPALFPGEVGSATSTLGGDPVLSPRWGTALAEGVEREMREGRRVRNCASGQLISPPQLGAETDVHADGPKAPLKKKGIPRRRQGGGRPGTEEVREVAQTTSAAAAERGDPSEEKRGLAGRGAASSGRPGDYGLPPTATIPPRLRRGKQPGSCRRRHHIAVDTPSKTIGEGEPMCAGLTR